MGRGSPSDWTEVTFGDLVAQFIDFRGRTPKKLGMEWGGGDIPALSANNVSMGRVDLTKECHLGSEELYRRWMTSGHAEKGDVLLTMEAPLGNVAQVPDSRRYILSQRVVLIKPRHDLVAPDFLKQYMLSEGFQALLRRHATGTTATGIQRARLVTLPARLPPLGEQKKIAAILSALDDALDATQAVIEQLGAIERAMRAELLMSGLPGHHARFKRTEIGEVPDTWDVKPLASLCTDKGRYGANVPKAPFDPAGVRYVRITDITADGELASEDVAGISEEDATPYPLAEGDIVFARSGATVGKSYVYRATDGRCAHAGYLIRFHPNPSRLDVRFLGQVAKSSRYWSWVSEAQRAQAQPNINAQEYGSLLVQLPPVEEQVAIVQAVAAVVERRACEAAVRGALGTLKSALMSVLLTGEVRVKSDEAAA